MDWERLGAGAMAVAAMAVGARAWWQRNRRANSRETVDSKHDEAEAGIISRLEKQVHASHIERNAAQDELRRERDWRVMADMQAVKVRERNDELKRFARRLLRAMPPEQRAIYETDFDRFNDKPEVKL